MEHLTKAPISCDAGLAVARSVNWEQHKCVSMGKLTALIGLLWLLFILLLLLFVERAVVSPPPPNMVVMRSLCLLLSRYCNVEVAAEEKDVLLSLTSRPAVAMVVWAAEVLVGPGFC